MIDPIEALADFHQHFEGWYPGSRSYRNRNPGNLRPTNDIQAHDAAGYRVFLSASVGYGSLCSDIRAKFTGQNAHKVGPGSTLLEYFEVYAPAQDHNLPHGYCQSGCRWLTIALGVQVTPATVLSAIWKEAPASSAARAASALICFM